MAESSSGRGELIGIFQIVTHLHQIIRDASRCRGMPTYHSHGTRRYCTISCFDRSSLHQAAWFFTGSTALPQRYEQNEWTLIESNIFPSTKGTKGWHDSKNELAPFRNKLATTTRVAPDCRISGDAEEAPDNTHCVHLPTASVEYKTPANYSQTTANFSRETLW